MDIAKIIKEIKKQLVHDTYWSTYLSIWNQTASAPYSVHLAIFIEPYLRYILEGKKTVESRFSVNRCAPYGRVRRGDVVLLKKAAGPIVGICEVSKIWTYQLDPFSWKEIRSDHAKALCAHDPEFWRVRKNASFATLMKLRRVHELKPVHINKRDRRGWVVFGHERLEFTEQTVLDCLV